MVTRQERECRVTAFQTLSVFAAISTGYVITLTSCNQLRGAGEDSWQHYVSGGMFNTNSPSLSSSGQYLAYASACTGHGDIYVIESGTSAPVRLTDSEDFESSPVFTADGQRILFFREQEHRRHIWMVDRDGTHLTQLTKGNVLDDPLRLSTDGRWLLFSRVKPSTNTGLVVRSYVMCVDEPLNEPVSVGDLAVLSGDSRFVVYSDAGHLWSVELDGKEDTRHPLRGSGQPLDLSRDGKLLLTARSPPGTPWTLDPELWVLDVKSNSETNIGAGHSAVFFGPKSTHVLFFATYDHTPYVTTTDGRTRTRVECASTYKMWPRVCADGKGAVLGVSLKNARPEYDVLFIDFESSQATTIASIRCSGVTFQLQR